MKEEKYICLLFDNYRDNKEFYKEAILREVVFAKKNYLIGNHEFITRSIQIVEKCIKNANENKEELLNEALGYISFYANSPNQKYWKDTLEHHEKNEPTYYYNSIVNNSGEFQRNEIGLDALNNVLKMLNQIRSSLSDIKTDNVLEEDQLYSLIRFNSKVFKNEMAYSLFLAYVNEFKRDIKLQAIFSFLFDVLTRLELIHCTSSEFIAELDRHDIVITRIDSKQCYSISNTKTPTFKYIYKTIYGCFPPLN